MRYYSGMNYGRREPSTLSEFTEIALKEIMGDPGCQDMTMKQMDAAARQAGQQKLEDYLAKKAAEKRKAEAAHIASIEAYGHFASEVTVGDLRRALKGLSADTPVLLVTEDGEQSTLMGGCATAEPGTVSRWKLNGELQLDDHDNGLMPTKVLVLRTE